MTDTFKSRSFWITAIVATVVFFVAGIIFNKHYVAQTNILLLPKSDITSRNIKQLIGDAQELPLSLAFYDIMLREHSDISDPAVGLSDYKRKEIWNAQIKIEQLQKSGILSIRAFNEDRAQAEKISYQTAKHIATVLSHYYNIKTELDVRIVDGPIVSPVRNIFDWSWLVLSLIFGLIMGVAARFIFSREESFLPPRPSIIFPPFTAAKEPSKTAAKSKVEKNIFTETFVKKEMVTGGARKAAAPENLPVGSEFVFGAVRRAEKAAEKAEEIKNEPKTHEATEEEIKNRLNKLLGGKL